MKKYSIWIGIGISIILLLIFSISQMLNCTYLKLEAKWLLVSGIPILLSLILGGITKTFKGFGIELEMFNPEVGMSLHSRITAESILAYYKGSIQYLENLTPERKLKILRLVFAEKQKYYGADAVLKYSRELPNLRYIEIIKTGGRFKYLIDISIFKEGSHFSLHKIQEFIKSLEQRRLQNKYRSEIISATVKRTDKLLEVYKKIISENKNILPVINEEESMIGVVSKSELESQIASLVLQRQIETEK